MILDCMILRPDRRNKKIVFTTTNVCRIGLNNPSNRLRSVFKYDWLELGKESLKLKTKIHLIQNGLELGKYMSWSGALLNNKSFIH